jgi:anti-sigma factor RsiW
MTCEETVAQLSAHVDGELPDEERLAVDLHLASCEPCRRRRAVLAALRAAVQRLPREAVSQGFDATWERRLASERQHGRRQGWRVAAWVSGMVAAILLAVLGLVTRRDLGAPARRPLAVETVAPNAVPAGWDCGLASAQTHCRVVRPCATMDACGLPALASS